MVNGKNKKNERHHSSPVTPAQFLFIILITIALAVTLDFGHRTSVRVELRREAQRLESEVATLEAENRSLERQREWVQTDDYVEEWARTEGVMVLRGETPVVPVPAESVAPTPPP
jgi:cell division protein FtsB